MFNGETEETSWERGVVVFEVFQISFFCIFSLPCGVKQHRAEAILLTQILPAAFIVSKESAAIATPTPTHNDRVALTQEQSSVSYAHFPGRT